MCLLILPPHSVQLSLQNSYEKHAYVYEACHTKCPLLPHKRQYILLYGVYKFPILYCVCVCVRERDAFPYGITFMMHGKPYNSPSPLQHTVSNPSCPRVMAVTTGIITHFSFCAAAALYSSQCLHEICLYPTMQEYIYQVQTQLFSGWWCWNDCPLLDLFTNQPCVHTFTPTC